MKNDDLYVNSATGIGLTDVEDVWPEADWHGRMPRDVLAREAGHAPGQEFVYGRIAIQCEIAGTLGIAKRQARRQFARLDFLQAVRGFEFTCTNSLAAWLDQHRDRVGKARSEAAKKRRR